MTSGRRLQAAVRKAEQEDIAEFRQLPKNSAMKRACSKSANRFRRLLQVSPCRQPQGPVRWIMEAIEMLVRDSMHRAGAAALERFAFPCQRAALLMESLPALPSRAGPARRGIDDVVGTECSPRVQRMMAVVGSGLQLQPRAAQQLARTGVAQVVLHRQTRHGSQGRAGRAAPKKISYGPRGVI